MLSSQSTPLLTPFLVLPLSLSPACLSFPSSPLQSFPFPFLYLSPPHTLFDEAQKYSVLLSGGWIYLRLSQILEVDDAASISMGINGDEKINVDNIGRFMYQRCLEKLPLLKDADKLSWLQNLSCHKHWQQFSRIPLFWKIKMTSAHLLSNATPAKMIY